MNRFLLAENPLKEGRVFILHTIKPKCLIEVCLPQDDPVSSAYPHELFKFKNSDGELENYALIVRDVYDSPDIVKVGNLLKRAWHWYKTYLQWEDKNIDKTDRENFLGTVN